MTFQPIHSVLLLQNDAHEAERLADILRQSSGLKLAGSATTLTQARALIEQNTPDLVLASLCLADGWSTRLMDEQRGPGRKGGPLLVVLAESMQDPNLMLALRHGADGYVLRGQARQALTAGLKLVLGGGSPMSPEIARQLKSHFAGTDASGATSANDPADAVNPLPLTAQERLMLDCISQGCQTREIASKLQITEKQVDVRIRNLYRKAQFDLRAGSLQLIAA